MMAQPTITAIGINPVVGDTYSYSFGILASPGSSGANQTWNFASGDTMTWDMISVIPFATAPLSSNFPNANTALTDYYPFVGSSSFSFYKTSSNSFQEYGKVSDLGNNNTYTPFNYSNPIDILHFPFTYNDSYTDSFSSVGQLAYFDSLNNFGILDSMDFSSGNLVVTADAFGTLITNTGTYSNVLRIHTLKHTRDSSLVSTQSYSRVDESYTWYQNDTHAYIAKYTISTNSANTDTFKLFLYLLAYNTGVKDVNMFSDNVSVYPNPTTSSFTLSFPSNKNSIVSITNLTGNQVATYNIQNTTTKTIDISNLAEGVYFVTLKSDEGVVTKKLVKTN
jgi:hypothetical protein